jgi:hypothetical protein
MVRYGMFVRRKRERDRHTYIQRRGRNIEYSVVA